jgi:predicted dehydrogenase
MAARKPESGKVRFAVVGAGWVAQAAFLPAVANAGNAEVVALVTGDASKGQALATRYGIRHVFSYADYDRILTHPEIDAVYLALPNMLHRDYAVPALKAGLHLLLETPMATSEQECQEIIAAAERGGGRLMTAYRLHFEPGTLDVLRRVRAGAIGEPRLFSAVLSRPVDLRNHRAQHGFWSGPVADIAPFPINAARMLFGDEPLEVTATGGHSGGFDFQDSVSVGLGFNDGRVAQFLVAYGAAPVDQYRLVGTEGDIEVSPGFGFGPGVATGYRLRREMREIRQDFPEVDQFGAEIRYFAECVLTGREPEPDGEEGYADVRVCAAIEEALRTGQPQSLPGMRHRQRLDPAQALTLPPITPPGLIHTAPPGGG